MQFTVSTKPLVDALNLGVINANVSKFHQLSGYAQLAAEGNVLQINLESDTIRTELRLKGSGSEKARSVKFVGNIMLKQLLSTLDTPTITLDFNDSGVTIVSGRSKYTLPSQQDASEHRELYAPAIPEYDSTAIDVDKESWKFIQNNQMYAIAMSFLHAIYTFVWVGEDGDVIVGDFDNGIFTHSHKSNLGTTCLLSDAIINLFNSLPDGAKMYKFDKDYIIQVETDSFSYRSQLSPKFENENNISSYGSDMILDMMSHANVSGAKVSAAALNRLLAQSVLLSGDGSEDTVQLSVKDGVLQVRNVNIDGRVAIEGQVENFTMEFKTKLLKPAIANYGDATIEIIPKFRDGESVGILIWDENLDTVLSSVSDMS